MAWIWSLFSQSYLKKKAKQNQKDGFVPPKQLFLLSNISEILSHFQKILYLIYGPLIHSNAWNLAAQSGLKNNLISIITLNMLEYGFSVNRWHEIVFFFSINIHSMIVALTYKWQWTKIEECSISVLIETVVETWRYAFGFFVSVSEYHDSLFRIWLYLKCKLKIK